MSTPAQVGKNEYRNAITEARNAAGAIRRTLKQIYSDGNNLTRTLIGAAALSLSDLENAITRLEEIGRNTKGKQS